MEEQIKEKSFFSIKNVLRTLALLALVIVFCPCFLVSCAGQTMNVSVMTAVGGLESYGQTVVEPHPIMLIALLIPIAIIIILFLKKLASQKAAIIVAALAAADFIVWLLFKSAVKNLAETNYCAFKTTPWFYINLIDFILTIVLCAIVLTLKVDLRTPIPSIFSSNGSQIQVPQSPAPAGTGTRHTTPPMPGNATAPTNIIGYCPKCGAPIDDDSVFCIKCGTKVPDSMIEAAMQKKSVADSEKASEPTPAPEPTPEPLTCPNCKAPILEDSVFCEHCGTKVK